MERVIVVDRKAEFEFLLRFAGEAFIGEEIVSLQLRSLWTAYCMHHGLDVDTSEYDHDLWLLWGTVSKSGEEDTQNWSNCDNFDDFMCSEMV